MWYSIYSVGDVDIDQEHANIDFMLSVLSVDDSQFKDQIQYLVKALALHFVNEEKIADARGYNMSDGHRQEHRRVTAQLEAIMDSLQGKKVDPVTVAQNLQDTLREHILEYDRYLTAPEFF